MAYRYVMLPRAQADYEAIVRYLAVDLGSPGAARHFVDEFNRKISAVCINPQMYSVSRMEPVARLGFRPMRVLNYVVLYTVEGRTVILAHIFHSAQDYARYV
ncbi:MAG: type II toxin-antitoxin system RelE/ParE family toxin [Atopobiaceae bacterium]